MIVNALKKLPEKTILQRIFLGRNINCSEGEQETCDMRLNNSKGFTLIETLVVVALVGLVAAMATNGSDFLRGHRLSEGSRGLQVEFQKLRQDALTKGNPANLNGRGFGLRFVSATQYRLFEFNDADKDYTYDDAGEEADAVTVDLPSGVTVTIGDAGSPVNNVLLYDKRGLSRKTDWSTESNRTYVLRVGGESTERCVKVGRVLLQEGVWNGVSCTVF